MHLFSCCLCVDLSCHLHACTVCCVVVSGFSSAGLAFLLSFICDLNVLGCCHVVNLLYKNDVDYYLCKHSRI